MSKGKKGKTRKDFKTWYEENGEELNESRVKRYETDSDYRSKAVEASRKVYREKNNILSDGSRILVSEGEEFVCLKITMAAEILGVPRQSILRYMSLGFLPSMEFDGTKIKFVTTDQIPLLVEFFNSVGESGSRKWAVQKVAQELKEHLINNWRNRNDSEKIINIKK